MPRRIGLVYPAFCAALPASSPHATVLTRSALWDGYRSLIIPAAMAKCFETWTVLPHGPLEKLSENLWRLEGTMPNGNTKRIMTIARMKDGRLVIHNAIALEPALQSEIEAFGTPASIVVPNGFHRQDAKIYKDL